MIAPAEGHTAAQRGTGEPIAMRKRRSTLPGRIEVIIPESGLPLEEFVDAVIELLGPIQTWDWMPKECFVPGEAPRPRGSGSSGPGIGPR